LDAFRFSPRGILDLLDSGRDECSADIGWCVRLQFLQANRHVVLDDCFVLVILGGEPSPSRDTEKAFTNGVGLDPGNLAHDGNMLVADT
jgi:hypothetical protein